MIKRIQHLTLAVFSLVTVVVSAQENSVDRTNLPIKEPILPKSTVFDARDAKATQRFEVKAKGLKIGMI